jgi:hypothetical protein
VRIAAVVFGSTALKTHHSDTIVADDVAKLVIKIALDHLDTVAHKCLGQRAVRSRVRRRRWNPLPFSCADVRLRQQSVNIQLSLRRDVNLSVGHGSADKFHIAARVPVASTGVSSRIPISSEELL